MDNELLISSLSFSAIGALGVYLSFLPSSDTLFEMIFPAAFIFIFGLILFPAALLKDGAPILTSRGKAVAGAAIIIFIAGFFSIFLSLL
ncbi:MAG: hypothetical protein ACE5KG_03420 [Nitrososphaerales archaeon]